MKLYSYENKTKLMLGFIFFIGVIVRFIRAFLLRDYGQDEGLNYVNATQTSFWNLIARIETFDFAHNHPPLWYIFTKVWLNICDAEWSLRLIPFLLSCLSLLLVIKISTALFSKQSSLQILTSTYFSLSSFFVFFGVAFRSYTAGIFLVLLLLERYLKYKKQEEKNLDFKKCALISFLVSTALLTNYSAIWPIGSLCLYIVFNKLYKSRLSKAILAGVFLTAPWFLFSVLSNIEQIFLIKKNVLPPLANFSDFTFVFFGFTDLVFFKLSQSHLNIAAILLIGLSFLGIQKMLKEKKALATFCIITFLFSFGMTIGFSLIKSPIFDVKNLWFTNALFIISAFYIVSTIKQKKLKNILVGLFMVSNIALIFPATLRYSNHYPVYYTGQLKKIFKTIAERAPERVSVSLDSSATGSWETVAYMYSRWYLKDTSYSQTIRNPNEPKNEEQFYIKLDLMWP